TSAATKTSAAKKSRATKKSAGAKSAATTKSTKAEKLPAAKPSSAKSAAAIAGIRVTHPERVIDTESGTTKGELVAYYAAVAPLMLPHLQDRPVAMLRAPAGVTGGQFFQKHADEGTLPGLQRLPRSLDPDHQPLLVVPSAEGLLSAAQMNV